MIIMIMVNIFSLSVSGETLPNPTDVMQVMVKYRADMYMVHLLGPPTSSRGNVIFFVIGSKGAWGQMFGVRRTDFSHRHSISVSSDSVGRWC